MNIKKVVAIGTAVVASVFGASLYGGVGAVEAVEAEGIKGLAAVLCNKDFWQRAVQVAGVVVSIAAVVFAAYSAKRQIMEAARENKISLVSMRLDYLELLRILSKCLSVSKDAACKCDKDGSFSPGEFASQMETHMKANPVLLRILRQGLVDITIVGKPFFKDGTECMIRKLKEGEFIFETEKIQKAVKSVGIVFVLAGGWCAEEGVLVDPHGECELYVSVSRAIEAVDAGVEAGEIEMRI